MMTPRLAGDIDVAEILLLAFIVFVVGLFIWIRREDKREGYPLLDPAGGHDLVGFPLPPPPKHFPLMHGGTATMPHPEGRTNLALRPLRPFPGSALVPTGDPMQDGVGAASWASKKDEPLCTWEGHPQLQPLRILPGWSVDSTDADPRGWLVRDADGLAVGRVVDVWLDHAGLILRYLEVELDLPDGAPRAMIPIYYAETYPRMREIRVAALFARQFAAFPQLRERDTITAREEDRVSSFCAGGLRYGSERRQESVL